MESVVEEYVGWCEQCGCDADPSVLTSLSTGWDYIKASNDFSLLPVLLMVQGDRMGKRSKKKQEEAEGVAAQIHSLRITRSTKAGGKSHLADANARVVAQLVPNCPNLKHIDLRSVGLSKFGAAQIVEAVQNSDSLIYLDLSDNPGIGPALKDGALATAISKNSTLEHLDLTNDQLGFATVEELHKAFKSSERGCGCSNGTILDEGNNVFEEILNALTHGVGAVFAIVGSGVLMYHASAPGQSRRTYWSSLVYCSCLVLLFSASTALHSVFLSKRWSMVLGLVDHAAIYFLIAGTYFPFCMISLANHPMGVTMAIAQWILAAVGIVFCIVDERVAIPFKVPIELSLYVSMGWMLVFVWDEVQTHISEDAIHLLQVGGGFYTVGITFFIMEKIRHPIYHASKY